MSKLGRGISRPKLYAPAAAVETVPGVCKRHVRCLSQPSRVLCVVRCVVPAHLGNGCTRSYTIVQPPLGVKQLMIAASCISGFTWSMHDSRSHACFTLFVCDVLGSLQVSRCVELCQLLSGANALGVAATKVQQACSKDNQQDEVSGSGIVRASMYVTFWFVFWNWACATYWVGSLPRRQSAALQPC